jgi:GT2 family glycosyltransferase
MDISSIIVTYNSAPCITACVRSLLGQEGVRAELIVVDNASVDDTVRVVRNLGASLHLIANRENVGFGRACNQAFAASQGRFLFLLNPDAHLEQRDGLARLCRALEEHPRWGLAGTRIISQDRPTEACGNTKYPDQDRFPCDFSTLPGALAWVFGASMIIRREGFVAVDGFDLGFFLYYEETDLCLRMRQHGWEIGFIPEVTVRHIGGASEHGNDPYETWLRHMTGLHRFWSKHYPPRAVRRLVRRDWFRASFRRQWYRVMVRFHGPASRAWNKHRKYAAISEASRHFLTAGDGHSAITHQAPLSTAKHSLLWL